MKEAVGVLDEKAAGVPDGSRVELAGEESGGAGDIEGVDPVAGLVVEIGVEPAQDESSRQLNMTATMPDFNRNTIN